VSKRFLGKAGLLVALTSVVLGATPRAARAQSVEAWREQVLSMVNQERAAAGLNALRIAPELTTAAQKYSEYMASADFFAHEGPDGSTPATRQQAAGYTGAVVWGENIAAGQPDPQSVMQAWMNSPGHRANILFRGFTEIGIGIYSAPGTRYGVYWTQEFGARPQGAGVPMTTAPPPASVPSLDALTPDQGAAGDIVTLSGSRFGSAAGSVNFSGVTAPILAWSDRQIRVKVPAGAASGSVYVQASSGLSNGRGFTVLTTTTAPPSSPAPSAPAPAPAPSGPVVTYTYPTRAQPGARVTLYGRGFGSTAGSVRLNDAPVKVEFWYDTIIGVTVPSGATSGPLVVETGTGAASAGTLTVLPGAPDAAPAPAPRPAPTPRTVAPAPTPPPADPGANGASNGTPVAVPTPTPTAPSAPAKPGRPTVGSINVTPGAQGRTVTIHGSGFGNQPGRLRLGNTWLNVTSWSDDTIVLQVPARTHGHSKRLKLVVARPDGIASKRVQVRL
jgi:uncharacterized protein YkwD